MGVGPDLLGRNVRCPTCREVLQAPTEPPPPAPPEIKFHLPPSEDEHSIFTEGSTDSLFDDPPPKPEMPTGPPHAHSRPSELASYPPPDTIPAPVVAAPPEPSPSDFFASVTQPAAPVQAEAPPPAGPEPVPAWADAPAEEFAATALAAPPRLAAPLDPARRLNVAGILLAVLVPYSATMTIIAGTLYFKKTSAPHPFEKLPDYIGDYRDSIKKGKPTSRAPLPDPTAPLPPQLKVKLGDTLTINQIEVAPLRVEEARVTVFEQDTSDGKPQVKKQFNKDSLALHVRVKNVSEDVSFHPTDPAFDRRWHEGDRRDPLPKPYTLLELGDQKFFGGPLVWPQSDEKDGPRLFVEGREDDDRPLGPGQQREVVFFSPSQDQEKGLFDALHRHQHDAAPLLWRVHLRCGLTPYLGKEVSTTCVVGVEFSAADVKGLRN
jgi:hypothetical protein